MGMEICIISGNAVSVFMIQGARGPRGQGLPSFNRK